MRTLTYFALQSPKLADTCARPGVRAEERSINVASTTLRTLRRRQERRAEQRSIDNHHLTLIHKDGQDRRGGGDFAEKIREGEKWRHCNGPSAFLLSNSNDSLMSRSTPECQWDGTGVADSRAKTHTQDLHRLERFPRAHSNKAVFPVLLTNRPTSKTQLRATCKISKSFNKTRIQWHDKMLNINGLALLIKPPDWIKLCLSKQTPFSSFVYSAYCHVFEM